jgi:hypothetical protein
MSKFPLFYIFWREIQIPIENIFPAKLNKSKDDYSGIEKLRKVQSGFDIS